MTSAVVVSAFLMSACDTLLEKPPVAGPEGGVVEYIVTFEANGGEPAPAPQSVIAGSTVMQPEPVYKTGYGFAGWFSDEDCTAVWNFAAGRVDSALTLYALWDMNSYTVTFETDETVPEDDIPPPQVIGENALAVEPSPLSRTGYLYGWYKSEDGTELWDFTEDAVTEDTTLYLLWTPITYTIDFEANGTAEDTGDGMEPMTLSYGTEYNLSANTYTRDFHTFLGWNTEPDGSGDSYEEEQLVGNLTAGMETVITLYAQWALSVNLLQAYINAQIAEGLGLQSTNPIPLQIAAELSEANWGMIQSAIPGDKYVALDLSGCTPSSATSGGGLRADGIFNGATSYTGCSRITEITLPDTVLEIAANSFSTGNFWDGYASLTTINMPKVQTIGLNAFKYAMALHVINAPEVVTIGASAFQDCLGLESLSFPAARNIGTSAFANVLNPSSESLRYLQDVYIPQAQIIGDGAFSNHFSTEGAVNSITLGPIPPTVGTNIFNSLAITLTVYIPAGSEAAYGSASFSAGDTATSNWGNSFRGGLSTVTLTFDTYQPVQPE